MNIRHAAVSAAQITILACSTALIASPALSQEPRGVVELFTSQGCSSCPAADKVAGELSKDPSLITMSLPVDYWDYLGWKDTLALHSHSERERAYANARGDREIYTPQVVVNGVAQVLGSDKSAIERAVTQTRRTAEPLRIPVKLTVANGKVTADVPAATGDQRSGEVWLCPMTSKVTVNVGRGENHGHTLTYSNVVRRWVKLGDWNGQAQSFSVPLSTVSAEDVDMLTVLLQSGVAAKPGAMLGAATAELH
jgi:hypothetical protein